MTKPVLVQSSVHGELRIDSALQNEVCSDLRNTSLVMQEFRMAALHYPIVFTKNQETGEFSCVALFGFDEGENLYVQDNQWDALYIPLNVIRGPFMLGTQQTAAAESADEVEHVLLIDMDDPRVNQQKGELLFNDRGFPTPYLDKMTSVVKTLKDGMQDTAEFIKTLLSLNLVAPAQLKIEFANGEHREVRGIYTIDVEALKSLSAAELQMLNEKSYLESVYAVQISFGHIRSLIDRKNKLK